MQLERGRKTLLAAEVGNINMYFKCEGCEYKC